MKKKPMIKRTPSNEEIKMYNEMEFEFVMAMSNKDIRTIKMMLCDDGTFFGKLRKWQALKFLRDQFEALSENNEDIMGVKPKIALGNHSGKRALMFNEGCFPKFPSLDTKPLAFVLDVEDDMLTGLYLTTHFTDFEDFDELSKNN